MHSYCICSLLRLRVCADPISGSVTGGTLVTVSGLCFTPTDTIRCRFGFANSTNMETVGAYVDAFRASCVSPLAQRVEHQPVFVSQNGGSAMPNSTWILAGAFQYVRPDALELLRPFSISINATLEFTLDGAGGAGGLSGRHPGGRAQNDGFVLAWPANDADLTVGGLVYKSQVWMLQQQWPTESANASASPSPSPAGGRRLADSSASFSNHHLRHSTGPSTSQSVHSSFSAPPLADASFVVSLEASRGDTEFMWSIGGSGEEVTSGEEADTGHGFLPRTMNGGAADVAAIHNNRGRVLASSNTTTSNSTSNATWRWGAVLLHTLTAESSSIVEDDTGTPWVVVVLPARKPLSVPFGATLFDRISE